MNGPTTLLCKIVPSGDIPDNSTATFDSEGRLVMAETAPGYRLPDTFSVEVDEGSFVSVVKDKNGHVVDEDDLEFFISMVFG